MSNGNNLLSSLASASAAVNENVELLESKKITSETLVAEIEKSLTKATIKTIEAIAEGNQVAVSEFGNFYMAIVQRFIGDQDKISFIVDTNTRFMIAENTMAQAYILVAYLLRINDLDSAKLTLARNVKGKLEGHYVARTIYTLRSRAGLEKYSRGWCIGIAEKLFKRDKDLQSLFFHDNDQFLDLVCQADFLQYYLEFKQDNDLYRGYPNFLYYPKKHVEPLFDKLIEHGEDEEQLKELVSAVKKITAGDFFMRNAWKR